MGAFKTLLATVVGLCLGLYATWYAVEQDVAFGSVRAGPWVGQLRNGTREADPYARAALARHGETPIGLTEGLSFIAREDDAGAPLNPSCSYHISGPIPPARYWTISLLSPQGHLLPVPLDRHGFTSAEVLRDARGHMRIEIAASARPGNWLPAPKDRDFVVMLRLYDTALSANAGSVTAATMPRLTPGACA